MVVYHSHITTGIERTIRGKGGGGEYWNKNLV